MPPPAEPRATATTTVAIVGAGFGGIAAALRMREIGVDDFVMLERADDIGGTWRDNTYPGCACDIPSHLYSLASEPKSDWTCKYAPQPEIWDYLLNIVDRHDLREHLWTGAEVVSCRFDETTARWTLATRDGRRLTARVVISAIGALRDPNYPDIAGRDRFGGPQTHTARWDPDLDLHGKRVGVVGTGASAIQVIPEAADVASHVTVFQRSPAWVVPRMDRAYTEIEKWAFGAIPGARRLHRALIYATKELRYVAFDHAWVMRGLEALVRAHLHHEVDDPELAKKLSPNYHMGCKRILVSDDYYPAVAQDHVEIETSPIARVTERGVETQDGHHDLDVIVWATGFDVQDVLGTLDVRGLDGRDLASYWGDRPAAYQGTTVPGFPNFFLLLGPNTGLGHNSVVLQIESQLNYVAAAMERLERHEHVAYVDVKRDALERWKTEVAERTDRSVWATGCDSWYLGPDGYNFTLWPGSTWEYRLRMRRFDTRSYRLARWSQLPASVPESEPAVGERHSSGR